VSEVSAERKVCHTSTGGCWGFVTFPERSRKIV
jgi:hypothetical protein